MISEKLKKIKKKMFKWIIKKNSIKHGHYIVKDNKIINKKNKKSAAKKTKWFKIFFKYLIYSFFSIFILGLLIAFYLFTTLEIPSINKIDKKSLAQSTKIYDRTGKYMLYDFHGDERRTEIKIKNISKNLINATVAVEDKDFYLHNGFKLKSVLKAAYQNIIARKIVRGGSTITQQVVKNYALTRKKTFRRKAIEIIMALKLEKVKTKEEILEMYLNQIPYGGQIYGIEEASRVYFGKPAADLSILESAYLAAIPNAPSLYTPYISKNKERLEKRKDLILKMMYEQGYITATELKDALESKVTFLSSGESNNMRAPHFTNYVINQLKKMYTIDELTTSGFKVYTTLNWDLQKELEKELTKDKKRLKKFKATNAAMVTVDNRNGEILAMIGSLDFYSKEIDGQTNVAISRRQPGSTAKPFAYAELISQGYSPETILWDVPTQFNLSCKPTAKNEGSCYRPLNYGALYNINGPISLRRALVMSLNIPAVKVMYLAGIKEVNDLANNMGLNLVHDYSYYGLSFVLGGAEVRLLDLVSAYGVFGNDGVRNQTVSIIKIIDMDNEEVYYRDIPNRKKVLGKNTARVISDMLTSHSQSSNIYFPGKKVAVKTGTTNDYRDVWTVGYSKKVSMGMWVGNNNDSSMTANSSSTIVAPVWRKLMKIVNKYYIPETFSRANYSYAIKDRTMLNGQWKIENTETGYITGHNILHFVNKENIRKKVIKRDSAYRNWEYGVQEWLNKKGYNKETVIKEDENNDGVDEDIAVNNGTSNSENNSAGNNNNIEIKNKESDKQKTAQKNTDNNQNAKKSKKGILDISISKLNNITSKDKIKIKVNLKNADIVKISYFVNSKRVVGSSTNMTMDLSTFLGLKKKNNIQIKVIDKKNNIYEKNYIFTLSNM